MYSAIFTVNIQIHIGKLRKNAITTTQKNMTKIITMFLNAASSVRETILLIFRNGFK